MDGRSVALGEPDMVRVASEPYRKSIRDGGCLEWSMSTQAGCAGTARGMPWAGLRRYRLRPVCPFARPRGSRSLPRRPFLPIRVTPGEYLSDPSLPSPPFRRARPIRASHASHMRAAHVPEVDPDGGSDISGIIGRERTRPDGAHFACGDGGPARQALRTYLIRSRGSRAALDGACHRAAVRDHGVPVVP